VGFALTTWFILRGTGLGSSLFLLFVFPSLSFRASVGRGQIISQMLLEPVVVSDALHAPDDQLLTKNVIHQRSEGGRRIYLSPGIEILHDLTRGDPTFEAFVLLGYRNLSSGWFSAQFPTEKNSCACLFPSTSRKRMVNPIILYLHTEISWVNGTWFES